MMRQMVLTVCENGRIFFEDRTPNELRRWVLNDKEIHAPFYIRVHAETTIYHVVSFVLTRTQMRHDDAYTVSRAAVQAVVNAKRIDTIDLNEYSVKWKKKK